MKQNYLSEIIYQVFALIICVIVVHTVYVAVVLPNAAFILEQQAAMQAADSSCANVVFPAPFGPAMMMIFFTLSGSRKGFV